MILPIIWIGSLVKHEVLINLELHDFNTTIGFLITLQIGEVSISHEVRYHCSDSVVGLNIRMESHTISAINLLIIKAIIKYLHKLYRPKALYTYLRFE